MAIFPTIGPVQIPPVVETKRSLQSDIIECAFECFSELANVLDLSIMEACANLVTISPNVHPWMSHLEVQKLLLLEKVHYFHIRLGAVG